jgi:hypothetical protein
LPLIMRNSSAGSMPSFAPSLCTLVSGPTKGSDVNAELIDRLGHGGSIERGRLTAAATTHIARASRAGHPHLSPPLPTSPHLDRVFQHLACLRGAQRFPSAGQLSESSPGLRTSALRPVERASSIFSGSLKARVLGVVQEFYLLKRAILHEKDFNAEHIEIQLAHQKSDKVAGA